MLSILVLVGTLVANPVAPPVAKFRLAVMPIESGYRIECAEGCSWLDVNFECKNDCRVIVDNRGLHPITEQSTSPETTFSFEFHRTTKGWELTGLSGTSWLSLGVGCRTIGCSADVDESGVRVN